MSEWDVFAARGLKISNLPSLDAWLKEETRLGNPALEAKVKATNDVVLARVLAWSKEVNQLSNKEQNKHDQTSAIARRPAENKKQESSRGQHH